MSKQYDNNMRGVLFKNDDKQTDKHPDYTGSCQISGVDFWMSAWLNEAESGRKYMSFQFKKKEVPQGQQTGKGSNDARRKQEQDDDIPF